MKSRFLPFIFTILCILSTAQPAKATSSEWIGADHMKARLIAAQNAEGQTDLALQVQMDTDWHSYWRTPGEAGLPYRFNWNGTQNAENFKIAWPLPKRFSEFGLRTFGYTGNIIFPITFNRTDPTTPSKLVLTLNTMVCKDICIPQNFLIQFPLPKESTTTNAALIGFGKRKTPHDGDTDTLKIDSVITGPDALIINATAENGFKDADILVELPGQMLLTKTDIQINKDDPKRAMIKLLAPDDANNFTAYLSDKTITITLIAGKEAIEKKVKL